MGTGGPGAGVQGSGRPRPPWIPTQHTRLCPEQRRGQATPSAVYSRKKGETSSSVSNSRIKVNGLKQTEANPGPVKGGVGTPSRQWAGWSPGARPAQQGPLPTPSFSPFPSVSVWESGHSCKSAAENQDAWQLNNPSSLRTPNSRKRPK